MTVNNKLVDDIFNKKRHKSFRKLKYIVVNFDDSSINRIDVNKYFWIILFIIEIKDEEQIRKFLKD